MGVLPFAQSRVKRTNTVNGLWVSEGSDNLAEGSTNGRGPTVNLCLQGAFCVTLHLSPQSVVTAAAERRVWWDEGEWVILFERIVHSRREGREKRQGAYLTARVDLSGCFLTKSLIAPIVLRAPSTCCLIRMSMLCVSQSTQISKGSRRCGKHRPGKRTLSGLMSVVMYRLSALDGASTISP